MNTKFKEKHGGFTLVELLVVIAIIGLLSGMVVISISNVKAKSRDAERVSEINSIATALGLYHNDHNVYPIYDGDVTGEAGDVLSTDLETDGYITNVPTDPVNNDSGDCGSLSGYRYYYQSDGTDFYLGYCLETNSIHGKAQGENYYVP
jgi:prepilin-type N-terminal cleavage/methylation domain-containing protein